MVALDEQRLTAQAACFHDVLLRLSRFGQCETLIRKGKCSVCITGSQHCLAEAVHQVL
jgi:hypothetical protein